MLVSNNQSSTNWNSSFSSKEQVNSNEVFNLEFPNKIEIQSDIKTAKKLEINGIEYLEFPSSNVAVNLAMNSAVSSATAVSQATIRTATAYGYSVDSKGFMGSDFNKAAGLPQDFKIHKSTLDAINNKTQEYCQKTSWLTGTNIVATNIDYADTVGQYYKLFENFVDTSKKSYTNAELSRLPSGYADTRPSLFVAGDIVEIDFRDAQITHIFNKQDTEQLRQTASFSQGVDTGLVREIYFKIPQGLHGDNAFDHDMSVYDSQDGTYSIESMFVSFMHSQGGGMLMGGKSSLNTEIPVRQTFRTMPIYSLADVVSNKQTQQDWLDLDTFLQTNNPYSSIFGEPGSSTKLKMLQNAMEIWNKSRV
ncbi:Cj0814 family flagellar-dependent secreted protein [Campylobacter sp.]|uniref:Cj0814 family flagellar-dependent secreted protein n=1 Tax=Campylobacter sp. TaxID=205 RepID=UPI002A536823|nr:hypothetical protein [Campylobacter sp.]MDD7090918.1 hypothetical protein [Campylobacteraceae bacterium]MDY5285430.1 hypothetical protein [Campylobacter sp.]